MRMGERVLTVRRATEVSLSATSNTVLIQIYKFALQKGIMSHTQADILSLQSCLCKPRKRFGSWNPSIRCLAGKILVWICMFLIILMKTFSPEDYQRRKQETVDCDLVTCVDADLCVQLMYILVLVLPLSLFDTLVKNFLNLYRKVVAAVIKPILVSQSRHILVNCPPCFIHHLPDLMIFTSLIIADGIVNHFSALACYTSSIAAATTHWQCFLACHQQPWGRTGNQGRTVDRGCHIGRISQWWGVSGHCGGYEGGVWQGMLT